MSRLATALLVKVAAYQHEHPEATANEIQRAMQVRREDVLRAVRTLKNAERVQDPGPTVATLGNRFPSRGNHRALVCPHCGLEREAP